MTTEPEPPADFATPDDIINAWRPLSTGEVTRAEYWIEVAARRIRRRWRDVDDRIGLPPEEPRYVDPLDVRDIVVALVVEVLGGPPVPGARSYSVGSGVESRSVTLDSAGGFDPNVFAAWMVAIFEGEPDPAPMPMGSFPKPWVPFREWRE